ISVYLHSSVVTFPCMPDGDRIYLSLGSNLGDRAANLARAIDALPEAGVRVLRRSSVYETEPVDFLDQPWFLNCALEAESSLPPAQLLAALQGIERLLGSRKMVARGPRIIDLDILIYGGVVVRTAEMEIPHPRMVERRFVLVPLAELAPALVHPVLHATIADLLARTSDKSVVKIWKPGKDEPRS
ncbi:MAG: 2-amino-4-hydroxy-6-hydroxymethyldihydropteridine diphosphokinase, partial [Candidatus Acidiferrales bacterium]